MPDQSAPPSRTTARSSSSIATIPRTVEVSADRPDHAIQVWFDRETGVITRLIETIGGQMTRDAIATVLDPDAALPPNAFAFTFPSDARMLF